MAAGVRIWELGVKGGCGRRGFTVPIDIGINSGRRGPQRMDGGRCARRVKHEATKARRTEKDGDFLPQGTQRTAEDGRGDAGKR